MLPWHNAVKHNCNWKYQVGETCDFTCKDGYTYHSGSESRTCTASGDWSGSPYKCKGCPIGPMLPWHNAVKHNCTWRYQVGETCNFTCKEGYTYSNGDASRTCQDGGSWSGAPYKCSSSEGGWLWG
ncbi:complement factor B-like [Branchiostoma floridae]|uniref:Complement factor B-like n=1 Tax=Branchiostoma floridae TaxID=7739 RepID=A0A9J7MBR1_BRAFL|nr:complement factor B-like [Branchiostoma floridae]